MTTTSDPADDDETVDADPTLATLVPARPSRWRSIPLVGVLVAAVTFAVVSPGTLRPALDDSWGGGADVLRPHDHVLAWRSVDVDSLVGVRIDEIEESPGLDVVGAWLVDHDAWLTDTWPLPSEPEDHPDALAYVSTLVEGGDLDRYELPRRIRPGAEQQLVVLATVEDCAPLDDTGRVSLRLTVTPGFGRTDDVPVFGLDRGHLEEEGLCP